MFSSTLEGPTRTGDQHATRNEATHFQRSWQRAEQPRRVKIDADPASLHSTIPTLELRGCITRAGPGAEHGAASSAPRIEHVHVARCATNATIHSLRTEPTGSHLLTSSSPLPLSVRTQEVVGNWSNAL